MQLPTSSFSGEFTVPLNTKSLILITQPIQFAPLPLNQTIPLPLGYAIFVPAIMQSFAIFSLLTSMAAQQFKTFCALVPPDGRDASEVSTHC